MRRPLACSTVRAPQARVLDPGHLARIAQDARGQVDGLVRALGDDELFRIAVDRARQRQVLRQRLAQRRQPAAMGVGEQVRRRIAPQRADDAAELAVREFGQVGHARHEGAPLVGRGRGAVDDGRAARRQRRTRLWRGRRAGAPSAAQERIRQRGVDEGAVALPAARIALGQQLAVDVDHGIAGDAQLGRQVARGRQAGIGGDGAFQDGFAQATIQPPVHRLGAGLGQPEQQQVAYDGTQLVLPVLQKWFPTMGPS